MAKIIDWRPGTGPHTGYGKLCLTKTELEEFVQAGVGPKPWRTNSKSRMLFVHLEAFEVAPDPLLDLKGREVRVLEATWEDPRGPRALRVKFPWLLVSIEGADTHAIVDDLLDANARGEDYFTTDYFRRERIASDVIGPPLSSGNLKGFPVALIIRWKEGYVYSTGWIERAEECGDHVAITVKWDIASEPFYLDLTPEVRARPYSVMFF